MKTIYLAGFISTDYPETFRWREEAADLLETHPFRVLSPLRSKANLKDVTTDGGLTSTAATSRDIILRDYHDVLQADVILAHLENFGSPRPLLGTIYELAWAWDMKKPVVAIVYPGNYLMEKHPFVVETVCHYLPNVKDACSYIRNYFR